MTGERVLAGHLRSIAHASMRPFECRLELRQGPLACSSYERIVTRNCRRSCGRNRLRRLPAVSCREELCRRCEVEALSGQKQQREYASSKR